MVNNGPSTAFDHIQQAAVLADTVINDPHSSTEVRTDMRLTRRGVIVSVTNHLMEDTRREASRLVSWSELNFCATNPLIAAHKALIAELRDESVAVLAGVRHARG